jgi:sec-independent protein translocase protein TatC
MTLVEHLRELRRRLFVCVVAVAIGSVVGWVYYTQIFDFLRHPVDEVVTQARSQGKDVRLVISGVADAFTLQLKISCMFGLVAASPVWVYELWRFITPGLHRNERRWAALFVGTTVPLFLSGVALAYVVLPKGLDILFGFTPAHVGNYVPVDHYLSFLVRMMLVFGLGFLLPVFLIALNAVGLLPASRLIGWWRQIVLFVVIFAAIATPTGDPINLSLLAVPMLLLVFAAVGIAWLNDRRRRRRGSEPDYGALDDDEASTIGSAARDPLDDVTSSLDD